MPSPNPTVRRQHAGNALTTTLSAAIVNGTDTTFTLVAATGWPDGSVGNFVVTINAGLADVEKILCSTRTGTTVNVVTRGFDGTIAAGHATTATVAHTISALEIDEANQHTNATGAVHGVAGSVVGTTDAQALTNKTVNLASNTVTGTTAQFNAALSDSDFATLAGSETLTNKTLTAPTLTTPTVTDGSFSGTTTHSGTFAGTTVQGSTDVQVASKSVPRGHVREVHLTANSTQNIATNVFITVNGNVSTDGAAAVASNLSATWTAVTGRTYKILFSGSPFSTVAGDTAGIQFNMTTNPGGTFHPPFAQVQCFIASGVVTPPCIVGYYYCTAGGSATVAVQLNRGSGGTGNVNMADGAMIAVEDMGV